VLTDGLQDLVVSSPADCRLTAFPTVDLATKYWIKGFGFTLSKLLNSSSLAQDFDNGSLVIARLAPQDYHRWHSPVSGTVESITEVPGTYYTVNPQAINEPGSLDVFCENRRSVMIVRRKGSDKKVAIVAVGAMLGTWEPLFTSITLPLFLFLCPLLTDFFAPPQSAASSTTPASKQAPRSTGANVSVRSSTVAAQSSTSTKPPT